MFTREPFSYADGFACFHRGTHKTDNDWFSTLTPEYWSQLILRQRAGQRHKVDELLIPTMERYGVKPGARVLSLGCGMGFDVLRLRERGYQAVGCDFGGRTKAWLENGLSSEMAFLADAADIPLSEKSFDVVFLWHVIEHFGCTDGNQIVGPDTNAVRSKIIEQIRQILIPNGLCIMGAPNKRFILDQYHGPHLYLSPKIRAWAGRHNLGLHYFWDKRDFLLSKPEMEKLFCSIGRIEWLSLSIGLALRKGEAHKSMGAILEKYAYLIDCLGLETSFLSPALHLVAQKR